MSPKVVNLKSFINGIIGSNEKTKELQRRAIEFNRQEEEFEGYKWCDDDCYMCNEQGRCQRAVRKKEV